MSRFAHQVLDQQSLLPTTVASLLRSLAAATALVAVSPAQLQFETYSMRAPTPIANGLVACNRGFASGDLDGDGRSDLVIGQASRIEVLLQRPFGSLSIPVGAFGGAIRPRLADLDADGDLDIVHCPPRNSTGHIVVWSRNDGGATFVNQFLPSTYGTQVLLSVAIGDFDGDGVPDLVCSPAQGASLPMVLLRNNGHGAFQIVSGAIPAGVPASAWIETLDYDRDGALDLLLLHSLGLKLLRNVGGTFVDASATLPALPVQTATGPLATGDLDDDGFVDAAVPNGGRVDVLWGGASGFAVQQGLTTSLAGLAELDIADLDGDGHSDLVIARPYGLTWARGLGGRQYSVATLMDGLTQGHEVMDVDDDGQVELVYAPTQTPLQVMARKFLGDATEDAGYSLGFRGPLGAVLLGRPFCGDVDGDGRADLLMHTANDGLVVNHALGDGRYSYTVSPAVAVVQVGARQNDQLVDLDADGDLDLVVATDSNLHLFANDGAGNFSSLASSFVSQLVVPSVRIGDVDGNGRPDLLFAHSTGVSLVRNTGFPLPSPTVLLTGVATDLVLADLDGDGDDDLVTTLPLTGGSAILGNTGGLFTTNPQFSIALNSSVSLRAGDLDGDGDQDLVCLQSSSLTIFVNDGLGRFTDRTAQLLPNPVTGVISNLLLADFDDDGDLDLLSVLANSGGPVLLLNDGTAQFTDAGRQRVGLPQALLASNWDLGASDIDGDGDLDLFSRVNSLATVPIAILANQLRQIRSRQAPRLGGFAHVDIYTGPGFGAPGVAWLGMSLAQSASPLRLPWLLGAAGLDPATLQVVDVVPTTAVGVSSSFVTVPPVTALAGLEVWLQAAVLPMVGAPGLTNVVYERINL